ncbi:hypothetical protein GP486_001442 [Trichoglossum hirsutum]|uniref:Pentatricopeptide repeat domain-containing protein n=1 Tax=Trichoglossum hirsutum TaxID=265104 RepID=A0A9P8LH54_9PEZI|nr:hypothetical protein GP486_001442 [Trichoglossum hirsutum]
MASRHPSSGFERSSLEDLIPSSVNDLPPNIRRRLASVERLYAESDVDDVAMMGSKLVDDPNHCYDFQLWTTLLDFRERLQSFDGVKVVWRGIRLRDVALPVDGVLANNLWNRFLDLGLIDGSIMESILLHARAQYDNTGQRWPGVYEKVVGHFLGNDPPVACQWHNRLKVDHPPHGQCLRALASVAARSKRSLKVFRWIYLRNGQRNVYSTLIPSLCSRRKYRLAFKWHFWLIKMGDLPPSLDIATENFAPGIKRSELEEVIKSLREAGCESKVVPDNKSAIVEEATETNRAITSNKVITDISRKVREVMNMAYGDKFSVPRESLDDEICARFFATEGCSVDTVLNGMEILCLDTIGPLSLRELAIREKTPQKIANRITQMEKAGISVGKSVFSRLVRKLSFNNKAALLMDVLLCDQHPDVFDDKFMQMSLLSKYFCLRDWRQFRRTIVVLTELSHNPETENWNLILQVLLEHKRERFAQQVLEFMRMKGMIIKQETIFRLARCLLRRRDPGKSPVQGRGHSDDLGLVRNLLSGIIQSGYRVQPRIWRELLIRFGMTGRLDELESLVLWLLKWYGQPKCEENHVVHHLDLRRTQLSIIPRKERPLYILFHPLMINSFIAWGFIHELSRLRSGVRHPPQVFVTNVFRPTAHPWTRGLRLVKELENRGVRVPIDTVRRACQLRLLSLYGPAVSKRNIIRRTAERNTHTLSEMVAAIEDVYPGLFRLKRKLELYTSTQLLLGDVMSSRPRRGALP